MNVYCRYWEDNIPSDLVPPTDFDAPVSASDNGKDASASAIVASALLEIFDLTGASFKTPLFGVSNAAVTLSVTFFFLRFL